MKSFSVAEQSQNPILVWRFEDAPKHLQELSDNGGDEDWLAVVPPWLAGDWINWMGTAFGCCCVNEYKHPDLDGYVVRIGCHA